MQGSMQMPTVKITSPGRPPAAGRVADHTTKREDNMRRGNTARKQLNFIGQKPCKIAQNSSKIHIFVVRPTKLGRQNKIDENERIFVSNRRK
jgi:hypothetical protein